MPLVAGESHPGIEGAGFTASHEMDHGAEETDDNDAVDVSKQILSEATTTSTEMVNDVFEPMGPDISRKRKHKVNVQETIDSSSELPGSLSGKKLSSTSTYDENVDVQMDSIAALQLRRAWLLNRAWAAIEKVSKISASVLVNKRQCEHIADHFRVIGDILEQLGLGKDFVDGQTLDWWPDLTFDETRFGDIAKTFKKQYDKRVERIRSFGFRPFDTPDFYTFIELSNFKTQIQKVSSLFEEYVRERNALVGPSEESLFKHFHINEDSHWENMLRMIKEEGDGDEIEFQSLYGVTQPLDRFLYSLLGVLQEGNDLVLFHSGLEGVNHEVVERTGLRGEGFVAIHTLLFKLLDSYNCLLLCEGTQFARFGSYSCQDDPCQDQTLIYYLNSNYLGGETGLNIDDGIIRNIEVAIALSQMLERSDSVLETLSLRGSKLRGSKLPCYLMVIAALSKSTSLMSLDVDSKHEALQELCDSLAANKVLKNLTIHFGTTLEENSARIFCAMLKDNRSITTLRLRTDGINPRAAALLGAMLTENSTLENLDVRGNKLGAIGVEHLMRPLMAGKDGAPHVNTSLQRLDIGANAIGREVGIVAQTLRTNTALTHFSMGDERLHPDQACEIIDSLKYNKTLQELDLRGCSGFDYEFEKKQLIDLVVNYNFTLRRILTPGIDSDIERFLIMWETSSAERANYLPEDLFQPHQLKRGEGSFKKESASSTKGFVNNQTKSAGEEGRSRFNVFLSYSDEDIAFATMLQTTMESSNFDVIHPNSYHLAEVVGECQLVIVVLSSNYLTSIRSQELGTILKARRTCNPTVKVYFMFYNLTRSELQRESSRKSPLRNEALWNLLAEKEEQLERTKALIMELKAGRITFVRFCKLFSEVLREMWIINGAEFEKYDRYEKCIQAILEEIRLYLPTMEKECNIDQTSGYQGKVEMESKLSLGRMKPLLRPLLENKFLWQRKINMAQYLQEKYIKHSSFEDMCLDMSDEQKCKFGKGRITAVLFPATFIYHFKLLLLQFPDDRGDLSMLNSAAESVAEKIQEIGGKTSTFFDFVDFGTPLDPSKTIAICQNFKSGMELEGDVQSNTSKQVFIVQDDLTQAYYYNCSEASDLKNRIIKDSVGVVGVKANSIEIRIENMWNDGSYHSGVLEDFSYKFESDQNKQCATKAFGDLSGAQFLSENCGIKCSPLLIIALASAIQRKGLTLSWNNGKGHMEFNPKLVGLAPTVLEMDECQILYTDTINELGEAVEWGMNQNNTSSSCNEVPRHESTQGRCESNVTFVDSNRNRADNIALYAALAADKFTFGGGIKVASTGADVSVQIRDPRVRQLMDQTCDNIEHYEIRDNGGFEEIEAHGDIKAKLHQGILHAENFNYLVVYDDYGKGYLSTYVVMQSNELEWISDFVIGGGSKKIAKIFKHLRGDELVVKREGNVYNRNQNQSVIKVLTGLFSTMVAKKNMAILNMKSILGVDLKSNNDWERIICRQDPYSNSNDFWWEASYMEAVLCSRTRYSSGKLLAMGTESREDVVGQIGHCGEYTLTESDTKKKLGEHAYSPITCRGKFSKAPASLVHALPLHEMILWGGVKEMVHEDVEILM